MGATAVVLIAVGLLGVGLTMAAALFPAAIKENEKSYKDSVGMMICQNGLAVGSAVLVAADVEAAGSDANTLNVLIDEVREDYLRRNDQHYPAGMEDAELVRGRKMRGCVILARKDGPDAHQLVSISYARDAGNTVAAAELTSVSIVNDANDPDRSILTNVDNNQNHFLKVGGWVIVADDWKDAGKYARIVAGTGIPGDPWYVTPRPVNGAATRNLWTVVEILRPNPSSNQTTWNPNVIADRSPVLAVMVTRTALRD